MKVTLTALLIFVAASLISTRPAFAGPAWDKYIARLNALLASAAQTRAEDRKGHEKILADINNNPYFHDKAQAIFDEDERYQAELRALNLEVSRKEQEIFSDYNSESQAEQAQYWADVHAKQAAQDGQVAARQDASAARTTAPQNGLGTSSDESRLNYLNDSSANVGKVEGIGEHVGLPDAAKAQLEYLEQATEQPPKWLGGLPSAGASGIRSAGNNIVGQIDGQTTYNAQQPGGGDRSGGGTSAAGPPVDGGANVPLREEAPQSTAQTQEQAEALLHEIDAFNPSSATVSPALQQSVDDGFSDLLGISAAGSPAAKQLNDDFSDLLHDTGSAPAASTPKAVQGDNGSSDDFSDLLHSK